jgi:hypothetical protein
VAATSQSTAYSQFHQNACNCVQNHCTCKASCLLLSLSLLPHQQPAPPCSASQIPVDQSWLPQEPTELFVSLTALPTLPCRRPDHVLPGM